MELRELIDSIGDSLGLHEELRVTYVVDGYTAEVLTDDGGTLLASAEAPTLTTALLRLVEELEAM